MSVFIYAFTPNKIFQSCIQSRYSIQRAFHGQAHTTTYVSIRQNAAVRIIIFSVICKSRYNYTQLHLDHYSFLRPHLQSFKITLTFFSYLKKKNYWLQSNISLPPTQTILTFLIGNFSYII